MKRKNQLKADHKIPITEVGYIQGKWPDGTDHKVLLDMGANQ